MDPPRHVKLRRLVNKGFTPRAVNAMEPQIRQIANEVLATARPHRVVVTLTQRPRGGITVEAVADLTRPD